MLTILHASDLQVGSPYRADAGDAFLAFADRLRPDVVVVAGDLTQRAKEREYAVAMELLGRLPDMPVVVTPGNHDVPLYRVWERLLTPCRNWTRFVSPERDSVTRVPGATLVALDSSAPRRAIVGGRLDPAQIEFARRAFADAGASDTRVLVVHHHFVEMPNREGGRPLPGARQLLAAFEAMGVDVVLGGHVHQAHFTSSSDLLGKRDRPGIPVLACGTTTSARGRGAEVGRNSLNVVRVGPDTIEVVPHLLADGAFAPGDRRVFPRARTGASAGEVPA